MKVLIDIPEDIYNHIIVDSEYFTPNLVKAFRNGTPIPDNATNGDVIKAMFDIKEVDMSNTYCVHFPEEGEDYGHYFFKDWWNSPYQKGGKE